MSTDVFFNQKLLRVRPGLSLFDCAEQLSEHVPTSCMKNGKCRECLVEVLAGMEYLTERSPEERHLTGAFRLSCRARVTRNGGTIRCHTLRRGQMRIEDASHSLTHTVLDPTVSRDGEWVLLDGKPLVKASGSLHGIAVDLGTTTVVMRLIDLETGRCEATQSFENPQRFGGSDIMARIAYDSTHQDRLLQRTLLGYMAHAIESFPCEPSTIYEMAVGGNATMRDLFFGLNVHSIGQKPYRSITEHEMLAGRRQSTALAASAGALRLPLFPRARVYGLPLIGSHVGADAAACMLAIDIAHEERTVAIMDIGTNTELIVGNKNHVLAASCPAGPAFEGGAIACGMPALEGAVESVRIGADGRSVLGVVGGGSVLGLCGSGLVDALSELLRTGRIDHFGRFVNGHHRFVFDEQANLFLDEADISQIAQAKGANVAGLQIAVNRYGIDFEHLDVFYLAGGFGRHINIEAAKRIGLIPNLPENKIQQIGNASVEGISIALCSVARRRELEAFVRQVGHVALETDPHFFDSFVEGCQFAPVRSVAQRH